MKRREFLKYGAAGIASASLGLSADSAFAQSACGTCGTGLQTVGTTSFILGIKDVACTLIDGQTVNMLGYSLTSYTRTAPGCVPGPILRAREGGRVQITITNDRKETHGFEIVGIPGTRTEVAPGCSCTITFTAPVAGTYMYHDPYGGTPLYRILGLHGVLVIEPIAGMTPRMSRTPYSLDKLAPEQRAAITALFDALGTTARFQGGAAGKWVPAPLNAEHSLQEKIWVCSSVDPKFNALITPGQPIASNPTLTSDVVGNFVPRYFTLNNRSGYDLHDDDETLGHLPVIPKNYIGEPTLLRIVNAGLAHHANHFHGNHLMDLAKVDLDPLSPTFGRQLVSTNIFEVDTVPMWPMQRRDLLLPYEIPPDIPYQIPVSGPTGSQFQRMVNGQAQEPFPLRYVMHCHTEMSQTAAGGNYPQGMVSHWEIHGGLGGRAKAAGKLAAR
ncbi:multicopper oxidase domain-containing protein [Microvirga aerophila]|nr:multicopper oxidase domain-containing protein [Microvirga aerophila]